MNLHHRITRVAVVSAVLVSLMGIAGESRAALIHRWSFTTGANQLVDSVGGANLSVAFGTPTFSGDKVDLNGNTNLVTFPLPATITTKTLVAWVANTNLSQAGGAGVLGLERNGGEFDSIVYSEIDAGKWMAGSDFFNRTQPSVQGGSAESSTSEIMLAIAYNSDNSIDIYREGVLYSSYTNGTLFTFPTVPGTGVNIGRRVSAVGPEFEGILNDARIYDTALSASEIASLFAQGPNPTAPEPSTLVLTVLGLAGLSLTRRRRKRNV